MDVVAGDHGSGQALRLPCAWCGTRALNASHHVLSRLTGRGYVVFEL